MKGLGEEVGILQLSQRPIHSAIFQRAVECRFHRSGDPANGMFAIAMTPNHGRHAIKVVDMLAMPVVHHNLVSCIGGQEPFAPGRRTGMLYRDQVSCGPPPAHVSCPHREKRTIQLS